MYQRILVPIDGSETSTQGLDEAIKLAVIMGASLRLIHVLDALSFTTGFEPCGVYTSDVIPVMKEAGQAILDQGKARIEACGVMVDAFLLDGLGGAYPKLLPNRPRLGTPILL